MPLLSLEDTVEAIFHIRTQIQETKPTWIQRNEMKLSKYKTGRYCRAWNLWADLVAAMLKQC